MKDDMVTTTRAPVNGFRLRNTAVGVLLLVSALTASALTIGRLRGAAWLGQPLDVSIQVENDPDQSPASLCFEAEVFHGDSRQDSGWVRLTTDSGAQSIQVRVQSSAAVDEPVVTVYVRETCVSKTARRFVLLSEIPPEAPLAPLVTAAAVAAPVPVLQASAVVPPAAESTASPVGAAAPMQATPPLRVARPRATPQRVVTGAVEPAADSSSSAGAPATKTPPAARLAPVAKPKLRLDPVEVLRERVAQLEAAAAQASQAVSSSQEVQRLQKLEQSVQTLLTLAAKNERSLADLRQRLEQAEAGKYDNGLVYGLAALLLAAVGGLAYLWNRQRQSKASKEAWWDDAERPPQPGPVDAAPVAATAVMQPMTVPPELVRAEPASTPVANEARGDTRLPTEIDLDDLLAAGAESSAAGPDMDAVTGVEDIPVVDFPPLAQVEQADMGAAASTEASTAGQAAMPDFPAAGEVDIDISHLSLSPVEPAAPEETPPAPLLAFDLPGLDQPADTRRSGPDKDDPASKA